MTDYIKLLPCPFCGGKPEIDHEPYWRISCEDDSCPAEATARGHSFRDAAYIWNTRANKTEDETE